MKEIFSENDNISQMTKNYAKELQSLASYIKELSVQINEKNPCEQDDERYLYLLMALTAFVQVAKLQLPNLDSIAKAVSQLSEQYFSCNNSSAIKEHHVLYQYGQPFSKILNTLEESKCTKMAWSSYSITNSNPEDIHIFCDKNHKPSILDKENNFRKMNLALHIFYDSFKRGLSASNESPINIKELMRHAYGNAAENASKEDSLIKLLSKFNLISTNVANERTEISLQNKTLKKYVESNICQIKPEKINTFLLGLLEISHEINQNKYQKAQVEILLAVGNILAKDSDPLRGDAFINFLRQKNIVDKKIAKVVNEVLLNCAYNIDQLKNEDPIKKLGDLILATQGSNGERKDAAIGIVQAALIYFDKFAEQDDKKLEGQRKNFAQKNISSQTQLLQILSGQNFNFLREESNFLRNIVGKSSHQTKTWQTITDLLKNNIPLECDFELVDNTTETEKYIIN